MLHALRRWILLPILLAILGAVAGYLVGQETRPSAEALISVRSTAVDGAGLERAAETAAVVMGTRPIFTQAASTAAAEPDDLRDRTKIGVKPNTQTISVTVTAPTSEQAAREANAIADAAVRQNTARIPAELGKATADVRKLISQHKLKGPAERARVVRLGDELAVRHSAVLATGQQLTLIQGAEPARLVPPVPVLAALGGLVGMLLGLGLAQLLGVHRGRVRSGRELSRLYPEVSVIKTADLRGMLALEPRIKTVFLAGVRRHPDELDKVTERVRQSLILDGCDVTVRETSPSPDEPVNGHISLVPTTLNEAVLRRNARDDGTMLLVPVQPKVTRLEALNGFAARLNDRSYLLVDERSR